MQCVWCAWCMVRDVWCKVRGARCEVRTGVWCVLWCMVGWGKDVSMWCDSLHSLCTWSLPGVCGLTAPRSMQPEVFGVCWWTNISYVAWDWSRISSHARNLRLLCHYQMDFDTDGALDLVTDRAHDDRVFKRNSGLTFGTTRINAHVDACL